MKIIIAGSRSLNPEGCDIFLNDAIERFVSELEPDFGSVEIVSGGARGADRFGEKWAEHKKIPVKQFIPDWSTGKGAGLARNEKMANYADALIVLWDGISRGTKHMIECMHYRKKPVRVVYID